MSDGKSPARVTPPLRVIMVKKRLASGEPCRKCAEAEDMLRRRDLWAEVDEVIWADEKDPDSVGMVLAKEFQIETAPFFVVETDGTRVVFPSVVKVAKDVLAKKKEQKGGSSARRSAPQAQVPSLVLSQGEVELWADALAGARPEQIVAQVLERLGESCALAFSGAEDVMLIDLAVKSGRPFSVFCLDTGRLYPETYRFIDLVRQHYGIEISLVSPDSASVEQLVRKKGLFSFYEDGHTECCQIRKVEPLRRALGPRLGWMTGQRRDQSPTRVEVPVLSWDQTHKPEGMLKANPLAAVTLAEVWEYIRENDVPYNVLHDRGYVSIGCEPCTRALRPGEHERAGRWWWEDETKRECGLHLAKD